MAVILFSSSRENSGTDLRSISSGCAEISGMRGEYPRAVMFAEFDEREQCKSPATDVAREVGHRPQREVVAEEVCWRVHTQPHLHHLSSFLTHSVHPTSALVTDAPTSALARVIERRQEYTSIHIFIQHVRKANEADARNMTESLVSIFRAHMWACAFFEKTPKFCERRVINIRHVACQWPGTTVSRGWPHPARAAASSRTLPLASDAVAFLLPVVTEHTILRRGHWNQPFLWHPTKIKSEHSAPFGTPEHHPARNTDLVVFAQTGPRARNNLRVCGPDCPPAALHFRAYLELERFLFWKLYLFLSGCSLWLYCCLFRSVFCGGIFVRARLCICCY